MENTAQALLKQGQDPWREQEFVAFAEFCRRRGVEYRCRAAALPGREVAVSITRPGMAAA